MTAERESVEVTLARIEERVASIDRRLDDRGRDEVEIRKEIARVLEESQKAVTVVRLDLQARLADLAKDLEQHQSAVNPHAQQEQWLRSGMKELMDALQAIRDEIATSRGTSKVVLFLGGAGASAAITLLVTRALGG